MSGWARKNVHMAVSAEIEKVVRPSTPPRAAESLLPGQVWPPPWTRYSSTSAWWGHDHPSRVTSLATRAVATRVEQPFRLAHAAASSGIEGPLEKMPLVPNSFVSALVILPVPSGAGRSSAAREGEPS